MPSASGPPRRSSTSADTDRRSRRPSSRPSTTSSRRPSTVKRWTPGLSTGASAWRGTTRPGGCRSSSTSSGRYAETLRRGGEDGEHQKPLAPGVADAVRHPLRRDQQHARLHRPLASLEEEDAAAGEDVV